MMYNKKVIIKVLFAIGILASCSKPQKQEEIVRPVRYQTVMEIGNQKSRIFSGVAQPGYEANLSFKVTGTIQKFDRKVGQQIQKGDLIASIDASDYLLQLEDARAAVKNADAIEDNAESNFERVTLLYENNNTSLSSYEAARSLYKSAKASEKSAKQRKKLAELQVSYTNLLAPVDGVIADVFIEENENVQIGQKIVVLNSESDIEVDIAIPELYISKIKVGEKVRVNFTAVTNRDYNGIVTEVAFTSGRVQTTYPVIIKIVDSDQQIRPGMAVDVLFSFKENNASDKLMVSVFAVSEDTQGKFVYLVNINEGVSDFGTIEKRIVTVGQLTNEGIEILTGLSTGDRVVIAGVSKIIDGMKVKLQKQTN